MLSPRHVSAVAASILLLDAPLHAQQIVASAIDAAGKRHFGSREFPGLHEPWIRDRLKFVMPVKPLAYTNFNGAKIFRGLTGSTPRGPKPGSHPLPRRWYMSGRIRPDIESKNYLRV